MSKQKLLLSVAAGALLSFPTFADTTISSSVDKGQVTTSDSSLTSNYDTDYYTTGVGNILITSAGSVAHNKADWSAITVNSNNYVYSNGLIQDNGHSDAYGIEVDMTDVDSWNMASGGTFTNAAGSTISGAAIYLDASSKINLAGDTGSTKYGIWLNGASSSCLSDSGVSSCVMTGDITMVAGSQINIEGTTGRGIYAEYGTEIVGDITIGGTIELQQLTATSTSSSGLYGMYMLGKIDGDVTITSDGEVLSEGASSYGLYLSGSGITGALTIEGKVIAEGIDPDSSDFTQKKADNGDVTYPEAATAVSIGANVDGGIYISGTVETLGTGEAILISPSLTYGSATYDTVAHQVIGAGSTGYGFYNTGTISIAPINANASATATIYLVGGGSQYASIIDGGIYNSGTISATVRNSTDSPTTVSATAILTSGYFNIGGYYDTTTKKYVADTVYTSGCSESSGYCYSDGNGTVYDATTRGSLTNTGTIEAVASSGTTNSVKIGTGAASTRAIFIAANSHLTSIVNSGTILASSTVRSDYTDTVTSLAAYAITDYSGTLTYIYNTGIIEAYATSLDNDAQVNYAIYLSGDSLSESGDGVTIISKSTSSSSAYIIGDIKFGDGDNQQIYVSGNSSYYSYLIGDISFGASTQPGISNGDLLSVGAYSVVTGKVTATNDVEVTIANTGTLNLLNDTTSLNASRLTVASGGTLSIGVSKDMEKTGSIDVSDYAVISSGATLGVTYNSYVPTGSSSFLLIRTTAGNLYSSYDTSTGTGTALTTSDLADYNTTIADNLPFLFSSASLSVTQATTNTSGTSSCTKTSTTCIAYDEVVLNVTSKTSSELGLTGYAKQMFSYINAALDVDPDLGAAMVNDIGDGCGTITNGACTGTTTIAEAYSQAQKAFNAYAPNMTGAVRQIAISLTDQATGVVGARQRMLRDYGKDGDGDMTLWGQAFGGNIHADGQGEVGADGSYAKNGYKENGYGFALGVDGGSPRFGWYGGALTFYNSSVKETGRDSHDNELWVLLSGYSTWSGRHLFFDSKIDVGYARVRGKRFITLSDTDDNTYSREADSKHAVETLSGGVTTGAKFDYEGLKITPQISVDGLLVRMEGYKESNPDSTLSTEQGFLLHVYPGYYRSLRTYVGTSLGYDFDLLGLTWQPELHGGYRYDFMHDLNKSKVSFKDVDTEITGDQAGDRFTLTGLDPARSNLVGGGSFGFKVDSWSLNVNFDWIHGNNGMTQKIGTVNFVVRL